ncbi:hypothetical protein D3C78_1868920 [compost metagenome]
MRIVLDRQFELPLTSKLVKTAREVPVIVAAIPPSALPGISPSRGEIDGALPCPTLKVDE